MEINALVDWSVKCLKLGVLAFAVATGAGCSGEVLAPEESGRTEAAIGNWINGWNPMTFPNSSPVLSESSPAACETRYGEAGGQMLIKTNNNRVAIAWKSYSPWASWLNIGNSSVSLGAKPACASLDGAYDPNVVRNKQVAFVAKGNSTNRFWFAIWKLGNIGSTFGDIPTTGTLTRDWAVISQDALASSPAATVHNGKLLVAGRRSTNALVMYSYGLNLTSGAVNDPLVGGSWTSTSLPSLPSGWTAINSPALTYAPKAFGQAMLVTLASNGSSVRLYRITTANGTTFSSWASIPMGLSNNSAIGNPSLETGADRSSAFRYTAYVHTGSNLIYEGSSNAGSATFSQAFQSIYTDAMADGPAAIGGNLGGDSTHVVFAKPWGSDQLKMTATVPGVQ